MKIGIVGSGTVGGNLGKGWVAKGHHVMFSSREPQGEKIKALLAEVGENATAGTIQETLAFGEVIAIAMPTNAIEEVVKSAQGWWTNKIVIDANNRFTPAPAGSKGSLAEDIAEWTGAKIVKAFNTIGTEHYLDPVFSGQAATMFICGDDADAKLTVTRLAEDLGFEVIDVGALDQAVLVENLARLWVSMAYGRFGRDVAFKLLRK